MRKTKKFAAVSMSAMMALASMAGCTKKDSGEETTQATQANVETTAENTTEAQQTTAAAVQTTAAVAEVTQEDKSGNGEADKTTEAPAEKTTEAPVEKTTEAPTEEPTEESTEEATKAGNGEVVEIKTTDVLAKLVDSVKVGEKSSNKVEVSIDLGDLLASTLSLTDVKLDIDVDSFVDIAGKKGSGTVGVDLKSKEMNIAGDLVRFAVDQDHTAINIDALKLVASVFGSEDAVGALLQGMGIPLTTADIKKITSVQLPVGTDIVDFKTLDGDALAFAKDYAKRILSDVDARSVKENGGKIEITPDGAFLASMARSVILNTKDEDIDKFFDIMAKSMPSVNQDKLTKAAVAIMDEIEAGVTKAGMSLADLGLTDFRQTVDEALQKVGGAIEVLPETLDEVKEEVKEALNKVRPELLEDLKSEESYQKAIDEIDEMIAEVFKKGLPKIVIEAKGDVLKATVEGELDVTEILSTLSSVAPIGDIADVEEDAEPKVFKFSATYTYENGKGSFQDVEGASKLSDVIATVLNVVKTMQAAQEGQGSGSDVLSGLLSGL